jgi:hypothetical protein
VSTKTVLQKLRFDLYGTASTQEKIGDLIPSNQRKSMSVNTYPHMFAETHSPSTAGYFGTQYSRL